MSRVVAHSVRAGLAIALCLAATTCSTSQTPVQLPDMAPVAADFEQAKKQAKAQDKTILLKFYIDWCTWCKKLDTVTLRDTLAIRYFVEKAVLVKINAEIDSALAQQYGVIGYPTLVLTKSDGTEIDRIIGYRDAAELTATLDEFQGGIGTLGDLLAQTESHGDRELYLEIAEKYKFRRKVTEAEQWYERVLTESEDNDSLAGEAFLSRADMYRRVRDHTRALDAYADAKAKFDGTVFEQAADIWTAIIHEDRDDTARAVAAYERFVSEYPMSEDFDYAKERLAALTGAEANK